MRMNSKYIMVIILLLVFTSVIFSLWYFSFRLKTISPGDEVPMSVTQIEFVFTRDLSTDTLTGITKTPEANMAITIESNKIIFRPLDSLSQGSLTITVPNVIARNGEILGEVKKTFVVKYIPYNELSKDEQKRQVNQSDGGQGRFEIINGTLPHAAYNYTADFIYPDTSDQRLTIVIDVYGRDTTEDESSYIARMEQAKTDVLFFLEKNKGNNELDDFDIIFNNDYLSRYNTDPVTEEAEG